MDNDCDKIIDPCFPTSISLDSNNVLKIYGADQNGLLGYDVDGLGDIDGDGFDDFAVSAPGAAGTKGEVRVYYGNGERVEGRSVLILGQDDEYIGALAGGKDVDRDGINDLVIGSSDADGDRGAVYLISGANLQDMGTEDALVKLTGENDGDHAGASVALGDLNGDGIPDIVTGAVSYNTVQVGSNFYGSGKTYGVSGSDISNTSLRNAGWSVEGADTTGFGYAMSAEGDLDGDGIDDLVVGAPNSRANGSAPSGTGFIGTGEALVFSGSEHFFSGSVDLESATARLLGPRNIFFTGQAISTQGDADGDGINDILVGALTSRGAGGGAAYLISGNATGTHDMDGTDVSLATIISRDAGDGFGTSVHLRDLNGDGIAEVIAGAPGSSGSEDGDKVYVWYGPISPGSHTQDDANAVVGDGRGALGWSVGSTDFDGNGALDLIMGVPGNEELANDGGAVSVVFSDLLTTN